jgi:hypothetical protein
MEGAVNEQVEILREIWKEMKGLNGRVTNTNSQLEKANASLDQTNVFLDQTNMRLDELGAELKEELSGVRAVISVLRVDLDLLHRRSVDRDMQLAALLTELAGEVMRSSRR